VAASDSDLPVQNLTFSLDPGAPAGATINSSSWRFQLVATDSAKAQHKYIVVRVTDDGSPTPARLRP